MFFFAESDVPAKAGHASNRVDKAENPLDILDGYDLAVMDFLRLFGYKPSGDGLYEGWSAGKPVVVTVNGGPNEFVWHEVNGLKIYPNPDSVAWGLGTLFTNFEWARWMGQNGRVAVESAFTWDSVADDVITRYHSC